MDTSDQDSHDQPLPDPPAQTPPDPPVQTLPDSPARTPSDPPAQTPSDPPVQTPSSLWKQSWPWLAVILIILVLLAVYLRAVPPPKTHSETTNLEDLLVPFVAIATSIERFWEGVFNWYERFALQTANLIGVSAQMTGWMATEVNNAEAAVATIATNLGPKTPQDKDYLSLYTKFQEAETRLQEAQVRIAELLKTPEYVALKKAIILLGSLIMGLIISVTGGLTLFNTAGIPIPAPLDTILTGLLIGAGPGPLHSFIGILQELRDTVAGLGNLAQSNAIKNVTQSRYNAATFAASTRALTAEDVTETIQSPLPNDLRVQRQAETLLRQR